MPKAFRAAAPRERGVGWVATLRGALSLLAVLGLAGNAGAWGEQGHRAVGEVAASLLVPKARAAVVRILGNDDLAAAAVWPDDVRAAAQGRGPLVGDPEVLAFNERHPDNGTWHFVNLPLGMTGYARARAFPSRRNIVEQIADCIRILEAPPGAKLSMPKAQALRMLIHLVGDLHQPLHVGTGYYAFTPDDRPVLVTDPGRARGKSSDRGGNLLRWGREPGETLHGDWDVAIPRRIVNSPGPEALAARLRAEAVAVPLSTPGDYRTRWARQWAGESLKLAANAYRDVAFGPVTRDPQGRLEFIAIGFLPDRDTYLDASVPVASDQLTKAAVRLAALLNRIAWR